MHYRSIAALLSLMLTGVFPNAASAAPAAATPESITVDASAKGTPFPHFWEQMFGSGRAELSLREDYRRDLRQ